LRAQSAMAAITRVVTVAVGVFAPGHLGELTQYLPFELVDDVLEQTRTVQRRLRELPSRAGVYFVLALGMYPGPGYARVGEKLTAGLAGMDVPRPPEKALRDLRRRLGPAPLKALFDVVAGPLAQPDTPGVRFGGLRTVAFGGLNSVKVPGTGRHRSWIGKIRYPRGLAGYPPLRLMALGETGARALPGATLGCAASRDGAGLARPLPGLLRPGMLVLLDRALDAAAFLPEVAATGAMLLARGTSSRRPPVLKHPPDGSYLSDLDGLPVRIIEADLAITGSDGSRVADRYRLITTLTGYRRYPAAAPVRLYHERREIESACFALRHTLLAGHVLRSGDRPGLEQEAWALLTVYQVLRMAMVPAVETRPGTGPDRASFTALQTARDQLTAAHGACPEAPPTRPASPAGPSWTPCCPPGAPGTAPATSNPRLPLPRPRRRPPGPPGRHHSDRHRHHHPAPGPAARPDPPRPHHAPPAAAARPQAAHHGDHEHRPGPGPARQRARPAAPGQTPQHAHPAGRMGPPGFLTRTGQGTHALNTPPAKTPSTSAPDP
jgi:hypothetical protein